MNRLHDMVYHCIETVQQTVDKNFKDTVILLSKVDDHFNLSSPFTNWNINDENMDILIRCALLLLQYQFSEKLYLKLIQFFRYDLPCTYSILYHYYHFELPQTITTGQLSSIIMYWI